MTTSEYTKFITDNITKKHLKDLDEYKRKIKKLNIDKINIDEFYKHIFLITVKYNQNANHLNSVVHLESLNYVFRSLYSKISSSIISGNRTRQFYKQPYCWAYIDAPATRLRNGKSRTKILQSDHHHAVCLFHPETLIRFTDFVNSEDFFNYIAQNKSIKCIDIKQLDHPKNLTRTADYCVKYAKKHFNNVSHGHLMELILPELNEKKNRQLVDLL